MRPRRLANAAGWISLALMLALGSSGVKLEASLPGGPSADRDLERTTETPRRDAPPPRGEH